MGMSNYDVQFDKQRENSSWKIAFSMIDPRSTLLDVGCSKGDFGRALMQYNGCIVDGIEPDKGDFKAARKVLRYVSNRTVEKALRTKFRDIKYDYVSFMDVIEHLYDPTDVLIEVASHLKHGGRVVFSIPNMAHISVRLMLLGGNFEYGETGLLDNTHLHFYTKKEIERIFQAANYTIEAMKFSEAIYPKALLSDKLRELNIEPTEGVINLLTTESSGAFQYIGTAVVGKTILKKVKRPVYSPDPQGEISKMYEEKIATFRKKLRNKNNEIAKLKNKLKIQNPNSTKAA